MAERVDLAVIGAGPAGLAAAAAAAEAGLDVTLIDDQPAIGGQIYRAISHAGPARRHVLGPDYARGDPLARASAHSQVRHLASATVWNITRERDIFVSRDGSSERFEARHIILATGAMERPMPFPGWTLPGVITAGAGQILLKASGLIPRAPIILAGSGPLLLLLAAQYLRAGAEIGAIVETTPRGNALKALPHLPNAARDGTTLRTGLALLREIRRANVRHFKHATGLRAVGGERLEGLAFRGAKGPRDEPCALLMIHQGVVPNVQIARALDLAHVWDALARCWRPATGRYGQTDVPGIALAGDGRGIAGAEAAAHQGRIAGLHAACQLGALDGPEFERKVRRDEKALRRRLRVRPFLDALFAPSRAFLTPSDETLVCRCEQVSAGQIRDFVRLGCLGPNQAKAFGRPGMGPCQGRFCSLTVSEIIADARQVPVPEVGAYRVRPPISPITLGQLAGITSDGPRERDRSGSTRPDDRRSE